MFNKNIYFYPWEITKKDNIAYLKTDKERYLEYIKRNVPLPEDLLYLKGSLLDNKDETV